MKDWVALRNALVYFKGYIYIDICFKGYEDIECRSRLQYTFLGKSRTQMS